MSSGLRRVVAGAVLGVVMLCCPVAASANTVVFSFTGGEQTFTVPAGVTGVHVVAIGGRGGAGVSGEPGGFGALVEADLPVTPGQVLYVEVAGNGGAGFGSAGGSAGFNGGGAGGDVSACSGGGGGGGGGYYGGGGG